MKRTQNSVACLGLLLACGLITLAATKPPKPPPPPPSPTYTHYLLGDFGASSHATAINAGGLVIGGALCWPLAERIPFWLCLARGRTGSLFGTQTSTETDTTISWLTWERLPER